MKAIRIAIALLVTFAVLAHGAVEPWSEAILEIGAALLLAAWALASVFRAEVELRWNGLLVAFGGLAALALAQWAFGLSVYGYATKTAMLELAAEWILLFLTVQVFRTPGEWRRVVWFLMSLAFAVSVFGIVQHFTWNGKLYWVRTLHHGGQPFGPFVDRNDFAGFVELILPLGLALLVLDGERRDRRLLLGLFSVFPAAALVLCGSRAGVLCFLGELILLGILVGAYGRRSQRWLLVAVVLGVSALAAWLGVGYTLHRFTEGNGTAMSLVSRLEISRDTADIFLDYPFLGTGMGTFEMAYPRYQTHYIGLIVNHAHNDYVELLSDGGIVGGILGLAFLVVLYRRGMRNLRRARSPQTRSLYGGGLVACTGLLGHELVEFNLHVASSMIIFLLITSLVTALLPEPIPNPRHRSFPAHLPS